MRACWTPIEQVHFHQSALEEKGRREKHIASCFLAGILLSTAIEELSFGHEQLMHMTAPVTSCSVKLQ